MNYDVSWLDHMSAWWAKADRAQDHLHSLGREVNAFRASKPYRVTAEPTGTPGRTAYRLHLHKPIPVTISTTVGDVLHNLRSALDSLAYEIGRRGLGQAMTEDQEKACAFPVCKTPKEFDQFFNNSRFKDARIALYGPKARRAFWAVQPFCIRRGAIQAGAAVTETNEDAWQWSPLRRLTYLSNLDKHRRLTVMVWWPELVYCMSNGPSSRRWLGADGTFEDGSILDYMAGDVDVGDEVFHEFNLVLTDDPAHNPGDPTSNTEDVVAMLEN